MGQPLRLSFSLSFNFQCVWSEAGERNEKEKTIFCFESSRFLVSNLRKITREETDEMALLSGGNSTLNPNAPLYIPAAVRQVEDFSPEWYDLISTSTWYRDYWLSQRQEVTNFYNNKLDNLNSDDIVDMLPDDIDLGIEEEDFSYMNSRFDGFAQSYGHQGNKSMLTNDNGESKNPGMPRVSFPPGSRFAAQPGRVQGRAN